VAGNQLLTAGGIMDNEQWRGRINNVIETLHGLDTDSFYDERDYSYHPIYGEIEQLATAFEINRDALSEVLATTGLPCPASRRRSFRPDTSFSNVQLRPTPASSSQLRRRRRTNHGTVSLPTGC
jgi:hypothetical protein